MHRQRPVLIWLGGAIAAVAAVASACGGSSDDGGTANGGDATTVATSEASAASDTSVSGMRTASYHTEIRDEHLPGRRRRPVGIVHARRADAR